MDFLALVTQALPVPVGNEWTGRIIRFLLTVSGLWKKKVRKWDHKLAALEGKIQP